MAMKTGAWTLAILCLLPTQVPAGQDSPLKWPIPQPDRAPAPAPEDTVNADWIAATLGQPGTVLLDVRDARGWDRWEVPPTFAAGHIPHALPFDPGKLAPSRGRVPSRAEIRKRLATLGPRPNDPVSLDSTFVLYGEGAGDLRTGQGRRLLAAAGLDVRTFPGGWKEWTAAGRPVVRIVPAAQVAALIKREDPALAGAQPPAGLILFDLREARDFAIGHLPGASSLPFDQFAKTFEQRVKEGWPGADRAGIPLVLYCYGPECIRSREAGAQAARLGFKDVIWFRGGIREWTAAGYPLMDSKIPTAPEGSPVRSAVRPEPSAPSPPCP